MSDDLIPRVNRLEEIVGILQKDVQEIKAKFPYLATKSDLTDQTNVLSSKIDSAVIGLLKDSMNAFPAKVGLWIAGLGAVATIFGTVIATIYLVKG